MKNIFTEAVANEIIQRIEQLRPDTRPLWGKMSAPQMLAHCNVTYELVYDNRHPQPKGIMAWMLRTFIKKTVVSERPYKRNGQTAPQFLIKDNKDFEQEKNRLIAYIKRTQQLGGAHFDGKESHSFGKLNVQQWNNMFYKHLDHHLTQFGV